MGSALARHAVIQAAEMGVQRLYLHTGTARGFYERLGWRPIAAEWYEGQPVVVMAIEPASDHPYRPCRFRAFSTGWILSETG